MINLLLLCHGALALGFAYLPGAVRTALAGGIVLGYGGVAVAQWWRGVGREMLPALLPLVVIALCWAVGGLLWYPGLTEGPPSLPAALRLAAPFAAGFALLAARARISGRVLVLLLVAGSGSALLHGALLPRVMLNNTPRLAPFASDLHTSSYLLAAMLCGTWLLVQTRLLPRVLAVGLGLMLGVLLWGNGVRSGAVMLVVFLGASCLCGGMGTRARLPASLPLLLFGLWGLFLALAVLLLADTALLDAVSSGRVDTYGERLVLLQQRDLAHFLFGTGPGSDLLTTQTWWWAPKDSHSDLLKYLWEAGVLGFGALMVLALMAWHWRGGVLVPLVLAFAIPSALSNALLSRPNASFLLLAFCAYALARAEGRGEGAGGGMRQTSAASPPSRSHMPSATAPASPNTPP